MSKDFADIVAIINSRRESDTLLKRLQMETSERYESVDWLMPAFGAEEGTQLPRTTPTLIADAVDYTALRAASVRYNTFVPALDPTKDDGKGSLGYANIRRRALGAVNQKSRMNLLLRRSFRHLAGYHTFAMVVVPDHQTECPRIEVRDPLFAYPEPKSADDFQPPRDCAFVYGKSAAWLRSQYPNQTRDYLANSSDSTLFDVAEWMDEDEIVVGIVGQRSQGWQAQDQWRAHGVWGTRGTTSNGLLLRRWKNRCNGLVPAVAPHGVSMARAISSIARMVQLPGLIDRLAQLEIMAAEKMIFPDPYIIGRTGQMPTVVGGRWKDGREGDVNVVLDADGVGQLQSTPGPATQQVIDRTERNFRVSTGLVPQSGGESYGALRTGRGIDSLLGASIDLRIQEVHELAEAYVPHLNACVLEMFKGHWPAKKYTMFSGWPGDMGHVEFIPEKHFESHENAVAYPIAGADVNGTTVAIGQALGAELIAKRTARIKHPFVDDADAEELLINIETMDNAMKSSTLQQLVGGQLDWEIAVDIRKAISQGKTWGEAITWAQENAKERQAAEAEAMAAQQPEAPVDPMAMPGMNQQQAGPQEVAPAIAGPNDSQANYRQLLMSLRAGSNLRDSAVS